MRDEIYVNALAYDKTNYAGAPRRLYMSVVQYDSAANQFLHLNTYEVDSTYEAPGNSMFYKANSFRYDFRSDKTVFYNIFWDITDFAFFIAVDSTWEWVWTIEYDGDYRSSIPCHDNSNTFIALYDSSAVNSNVQLDKYDDDGMMISR